VLDWSPPALVRRRDRLIGQGLLRLLGTDEAPAEVVELDPVEATVEGLELIAAQQGLTLAAAVRANGLAGGGPERPIGSRGMLLAHAIHTLGADEMFVRLIATARGRAALVPDPSWTLTASEIGAYTFCPQASYLQRCRVPVTPEADARRQAGSGTHHGIGRQTDVVQARARSRRCCSSPSAWRCCW